MTHLKGHSTARRVSCCRHMVAHELQVGTAWARTVRWPWSFGSVCDLTNELHTNSQANTLPSSMCGLQLTRGPGPLASSLSSPQQSGVLSSSCMCSRALTLLSAWQEVHRAVFPITARRSLQPVGPALPSVLCTGVLEGDANVDNSSRCT